MGLKNRLPWHVPDELRFFRTATMGSPIIMGNNTFKAIGRVLPGRQNIIVSGSAPANNASGQAVHYAHMPAQAINMAESTGAQRAFIIGGATLFEAMLPQCDYIFLSRIHLITPADVWLNPINSMEWKQIWHSAAPRSDRSTGIFFSLEVYQNNKSLTKNAGPSPAELWLQAGQE